MTIITQRLFKYLNIFWNLVENSKEDKKDQEMLQQSLDKLKAILKKVNDSVAFYQNSSEFKKLFDQIDQKSYTYFLKKFDKQIEPRKFTVNKKLIFLLKKIKY